MPPKNQAAWISAKKVTPFKVGDAPYTAPGPGQMVIKNGAVAINPFDWALQLAGPIFAPYLKYPMVLGTDVAGTVVEVGPDVTRFRVGDRVLGSAVSIAKESNEASEGAFQLYTVMRQHMAAPTPEHVTDEQACVLGLGLGTAAYGLFHGAYLGLDLPQVPPPPNPKPPAKYRRAIIVTGGASSVGGCAVQLCKSAGYEVISTSSPKNFAYVKGLGATQVFDYNSTTLVRDLVHALDGCELVGAYTIGEGADDVCRAVMKERAAKTPELPTRNFVALAGGATMDGRSLQSFLGTTMFVGRMVRNMATSVVKRLLTGIEVKFIMVNGLVAPDSCVACVYVDFLPRALAERQFVPAPEPQVVGRGLDKIQEALDVQMKGVSARKIVVSLP
jgi:NADPH:quinone reductase-like Zn-dependent oxidoreductase